MDFKRIAVIANSSVVLSGFISILLAYLGVGIWALVFNSVGSLVFQAPLFFKITGWKPKWYWNKQEFNEIFSFGIFTTGTNVMNYWMQNLDYLLIGKIFNASTLGVYTLAFILTDTFRMKLMSVINTVMYPMFSKRQDDIKSVSRYYFKVIFFNCVISFPIMTFLIVLGEPFVLHVFGTKWADSVIPLQLLAFSVMFHMMISGNNVLIRGMGKPNLEFKVQIVKAIIYIPMLIFGTYKYGVIGAASVVLINKVIGVFIAHHALKLVLNDKIKFSYFLKIVSPPIFASLISGLLVYWLFLNELSYIFCGILLFISYGLMIYFIRKQEVLELKKELLKL